MIRKSLIFCLVVAPAYAQQPPLFSLDPQNQSVSIGAVVNLRVTATGTAPFYYQWLHEGQIIPGGTNATLTIAQAQLTDAGNYQASISNDWGNALSKLGLLDVDPAFRKITEGHLVTGGGDSTGVAWGDFDNDGWIDLFVSNFGTRLNYLYRNLGGESFARVETGIITTEDFNAEGCVWGDYDNDGDLDLFVAVGLNGNDLLYRNDGGGQFTKMTNALPALSGGSSRGCAWGDFDNDGWLDLFVANDQNQKNFLFHNDGQSGFTAITTGDIGLDRGNSYGCSWADFNNDGFLDLFVANSSGRSFLYQNDANGQLIRLQTAAPGTNTANSAGCAWGDYDNDGFLDLFVANLGQRNFLYHNQGDGTFQRITTGTIVEEVSYSWGAAWGDYDNDGWLDLFVVNGQPNGTGVKDFLFKNNGDGSFTKISRGSLVNDSSAGDGCAWADVNHDGFLDLFVSNLNGQNNFFYVNGGNSNHWLVVECIGRASNASAIGARLELLTELNGRPFPQIREISGGSGYGSQNGLPAHFGLGSATRVQRLRVRWPSGIVQELTNLPADQRLTLREPAQISGARLVNGFLRAAVRGRAGTRYLVESSEDLIRWQTEDQLSSSLDNSFQRQVSPGAGRRFYRIIEP